MPSRAPMIARPCCETAYIVHALATVETVATEQADTQLIWHKLQTVLHKSF